MRRREFIAAFCAGLVSAPHFALSQSVPGNSRPRRLAIASISASVEEMREQGPDPLFSRFFPELRKRGRVEGGNLTVSRHSGGSRSEQYRELAMEVVAAAPDVIYTTSSRFVRELQGVTSAIPIVAFVSDPVGFGFAKSLARPGGNITGFSADPGLSIMGKFLDLLREVQPRMKKFGFIAPRAVMDTSFGLALIEAAGQQAIEALVPPLEGVIGEDQYRRVVDAMVMGGADGFLVAEGPENFAHRRLIVELINRTRLPAIYPQTLYSIAGGLLSYGIDRSEIGERSAAYVDMILRGSNPAEMPFQQPTKLTLVANLKTARSLGLKLPDALLARADEVIE